MKRQCKATVESHILLAICETRCPRDAMGTTDYCSFHQSKVIWKAGDSK